MESEVWALRLGLPGEHQLDILPQHVLGTPSSFEYHPFCHIDFKLQAYIWKQAANRSTECLPTSAELFMDFGFMQASTTDYKHPNKTTGHIVQSYDGFSAYLIIVDGASHRVWAFLTTSKEPPLHILRAFMEKFGRSNGLIRTD